SFAHCDLRCLGVAAAARDLGHLLGMAEDAGGEVDAPAIGMPQDAGRLLALLDRLERVPIAAAQAHDAAIRGRERFLPAIADRALAFHGIHVLREHERAALIRIVARDLAVLLHQ